MRRQSSVRLGRGSRRSPKLRETNPDGFGSLAPLGDVDHNTLALVESADPGSLEHRGVDEGILAAAGYVDRRAIAGTAVLLSTLRTSVTCGPFCPGATRTSSVSPGCTAAMPFRSRTVA